LAVEEEDQQVGGGGVSQGGEGRKGREEVRKVTTVLLD